MEAAIKTNKDAHCVYLFGVYRRTCICMYICIICIYICIIITVYIIIVYMYAIYMYKPESE